MTRAVATTNEYIHDWFKTNVIRDVELQHEKGYKLEGKRFFMCIYLRWMSKQDWKWRKMTIVFTRENWVEYVRWKNIKCKMHWEYHICKYFRIYERSFRISIKILYISWERMAVIPNALIEKLKHNFFLSRRGFSGKKLSSYCGLNAYRWSSAIQKYLS